MQSCNFHNINVDISRFWRSQRRNAFVLFVGILLIGSIEAQTPFKSYTPHDAKFTISFPGTPSVSAPTQQHTDEGLTFTEQHYSVADDAAYILLTSDYPFAIDSTVLTGIAKEQASSCGAHDATIRSQKKVQGRAALLFTVDCPKAQGRAEISLVVEAVVDGTRIYRVMFGTSEKVNRGRIDTFLISFHIN